MEYNPMEELGLMMERQFVCNCNGFITSNDSARDICARYIRNGDRFFDAVSRYDDIISYSLDRTESRAGNTLKYIAPFIKAYGATDHDIFQFCKENLNLIKGAECALRYAFELMPTFISTSSYEHHMLSVCDAVDFPITNVVCAQVNFDSFEMSRQDAKAIREMGNRISSLSVSDELYSVTNSEHLNAQDDTLVKAIDQILLNELPKLEVWSSIQPINVIGSNEKAYALLETRKKTEIDFDSTIYVGGDMTDYLAMDYVRDNDGLSISFNGSEFAVRGSNIAVISDDATTIAVLTAEFNNEGIEAVFDLVDNWNLDELRVRECPDRNLMDRLLENNPKRLPKVTRVTQKNMESVISESEAFRKKRSAGRRAR